jgi:hypothetical protein
MPPERDTVDGKGRPITDAQPSSAFSFRDPPGLPVIDDEAYARHLAAQGTRVKKKHGTFWKETRRGFWEPTHWLLRLEDEQAVTPSALCWGFRCSTRNEIPRNGGHLPVHLLNNIPAYDMTALDGKRRNQLRACRKRVQIVQLMDSGLLEAHGYPVACSALARTTHGQAPREIEYVNGVKRMFVNYPGIVLAGLVDGKLGGYLTGKAIGRIAYIDTVILSTEALPTNIGTGLVFDFVQLCKQTGTVAEVVYGLHTPEDPRLVAYKENMLFPVMQVPTKVWMLPLLRTALRLWRPHMYYRLTGEDSVAHPG